MERRAFRLPCSVGRLAVYSTLRELSFGKLFMNEVILISPKIGRTTDRRACSTALLEFSGRSRSKADSYTSFDAPSLLNGRLSLVLLPLSLLSRNTSLLVGYF